MSEKDRTVSRDFKPGELVSGLPVGRGDRRIGKFVRMHGASVVIAEDPSSGIQYPVVAVSVLAVSQ